MSRLGAAWRHPAALALALLLGAAVGLAVPPGGSWLAALGQGYIAVLNLAATPLIVVAVFFGLGRVLALPRAGLRLGALVAGGVAAIALCAVAATVLAWLWGAGSRMAGGDMAVLGQLSLKEQAFTTVTLFGPEPQAAAPSPWGRLVPDNFFQALAFGTLPAVLVGALCFGFALAAQDGDAARRFHGLMEAIYRALEVLIERLNALLPLMAFALAAAVASAAGIESTRLMRGFMGPFLACVGLVLVACAAVAAWHLRTSPWRVLRGLRRPLVVGLFSGGPAAAVPSFIDAMCNQLGFRRDLVEFAAPVAPVFLRVGDAVFFAVLAVFAANLYGRPPGPVDLAFIGLAATVGALASVAFAGGRSLAASVLVLGWLDLPAEALLPAFVLVEVLCEGLRTVLALALTAALVALASRGLASEAPRQAPAADAAEADARLRFVVGPRQAIAMGLLLATALGTACLAGIGLGLRQAATPASLAKGVR